MASSLFCKNLTGPCWDLGGFEDLQAEGINGKRYTINGDGFTFKRGGQLPHPAGEESATRVQESAPLRRA